MPHASNFTTTITVDRSPIEVFNAITDVPRWWTGDIGGDTAKVGDEFSYRYPGYHYSNQRVTELVPEHRVVWLVIDSQLDGYENPNEWTGTEIIFELTETGDGTAVHFTHRGLLSDIECYDNCSSAWGFYIHGSLKNLITTGQGPTAPPWA
jgi:uncharacterized protein YndB with AHSA1/START domain